MRTVSLIVAMSENRVIGRKGQLPWHLSEDLKRFKKITSGHPVIMGRKTYESIGRLLPQRTNIIVTRQRDYAVEGALTALTLEQAFEKAGEGEIFVIGGAEIYRQALASADRLYVTLVHSRIEGDAFFPEIPADLFRETSRERIEGTPPFTFLTLERL